MPYDWTLKRLDYCLPNRSFAKTQKDNRMARLVDINQVVEQVNEILEEIALILSIPPVIPPSPNTWDIPNAAFVSPNGDNATAVVGDGNKPYATIDSAITASNNIIMLPGIYSQNTIVGVDDVLITALPGVIIGGGFTINNDTVKKFRLKGDAVFNGTSSAPITANGTGGNILNTEIEFEFDHIDSDFQAFFVTDNVKLTMRGNHIRSKGVNGSNSAAGIRDNAEVTIFLKEDLILSRCIFLRDGNIGPFAGRLEINCRTFKMDNRLVSGVGSGSMIYTSSVGYYRILLNCDIHELTGATTGKIFHQDFYDNSGTIIEVNGNIYSSAGEIPLEMKGYIFLKMTGNLLFPQGKALVLIGDVSTYQAPTCTFTNCIINSLNQIELYDGSTIEFNYCQVRISGTTIPYNGAYRGMIYVNDIASSYFMGAIVTAKHTLFEFQTGGAIVDRNDASPVHTEAVGCYMNTVEFVGGFGTAVTYGEPVAYFSNITVTELNPPI